MYSLLSLVGIALIIMYLSNGEIDFIYLFKVPLVGIFIILVIFHIKNRLELNLINKLFIYFGLISVIVGTIGGTLITKAALTHLYMIAISIMGCSFGYSMAAKYDANMKRVVRTVMYFIFITNSLILFTYYYFHYVTDSIAYFGFDSILPLVSALFLADKKYFWFVIAVILVFLSGKRAPLVSMIMPISLIYLKSLISPSIKKFKINLGIAIFIIISVTCLLSQTELVKRWLLFASVDITDFESIYAATSGRSAELIGLWNKLSNNPVQLLIGSGLGGHFTIYAEFKGDLISYDQHYLHLAVATYILIFGVPFTLFLLGSIAYVFWSNRSNFQSFFYLGMLITFIGSLFGAGLIVDPLFWIFLGANQYYMKKPVCY